jgi:two-component system, NarL family, sensor histidine kinase DegS
MYNNQVLATNRGFRFFAVALLTALPFVAVFLGSWGLARLFLAEQTAILVAAAVWCAVCCIAGIFWIMNRRKTPAATSEKLATPAEPSPGNDESLDVVQLFSKMSQAETVEALAIQLVRDLRQGWKLTFSAFTLYSEVDIKKLMRFDFVKFDGNEQYEPDFRRVAFTPPTVFGKPELMPANQNKTQDAIVMKMQIDDKACALLCVGPRANGNTFTDSDVKFIESLAKPIVTLSQHIIEVEKLEEKIQQLENTCAHLQRNRGELESLNRYLVNDFEQECNRLADELQDDPAVKINAMVRLFKNKFDNDHFSLNEDERIAWKLAAEAHSSLRTISRQLHPKALGEGNLPAILQGLVDDTMQSVRLVIKLKINGNFDKNSLPEEHEVCLFRVVQAAMDNVIRHSKAQHVTISLGVNENSARVAVVDDGVGFTPPEEVKLEDRARYLGLAGMKERLTALGGKLKLRSSPGAGTVVEAELPLPITIEAAEDESEEAIVAVG